MVPTRSPSEQHLHNPTGQTIVIKVGTSSLLRADMGSLNISNLARICETVRDLHRAGHRVVVVSSGAIGVGCLRLGIKTRPSAMAQKQALAAVGQVHLMRYYEDFFSAVGLACAQVLLTQDNLGVRAQYQNARNTFAELFNYGTVPVVNENDTVAVEQVRFGDNDTLSAQVATLVQADWLFLLTDVAHLYTANPNIDPTARPIFEVLDIGDLQVDTSTQGTQWGTGGMATKLTAARIATAAGCSTVICLASEPERMLGVMAGERVGTVFRPHVNALRGKKRWILSVPVKGELWLDTGATRAVRDRRKSLFSAGITRVTGDFSSHDAVRICDEHGMEIGRGLSNYAHPEVLQLMGKSSNEIEGLLGYLGSEEVVHRDNIGLLSLMERNRPANRQAALDPDETLDPDDAWDPSEGASATSRSQATLVDRALDTGKGAGKGAISTDIGTGGASSAGNGIGESRAEETVASKAAAEPPVLFDVSERLAAIRLRETLGVKQGSPQAENSVEPKPQQQRVSFNSVAPVHSAMVSGVGSIGVSSRGVGSSPSDGDWQAMLREAIEQENRDDKASLRGLHVDLDDDITEEGWLPK